MEYFKKINKVPTFTDMIMEAVEVYGYKLVEDDPAYPEYKFIVPETENNKKYVYHVNLDSGFRGNRNDYEVTFYYGKDNGEDDIYSRTNNLGLEHLYSVLATLDAILLDAAARYPVRDFIVAGESTGKEKGDGKKNEANVRTRMYLRYAERHYPAECVSYEQDSGIMRIHAYELPDSRYAKENEDDDINEGLILAEGNTSIPYNDYSDFRKISIPGDTAEFNCEISLKDNEISIQANPVPRDISALQNPKNMEELFKELKMMLVDMATSLDGGGQYPVTSVSISSSVIPSDSVSPEVGKINRMIEHLTDEILFRRAITFTPEYKNGVFCAKCDTTVANLN